MKWFRWYRGTSENPKFALVARRAGETTPLGTVSLTPLGALGSVSLTTVLAVWCVILEDAGNDDHWGTCCKDAEFISTVLHCGAQEVRAIMREMISVGLLDDSLHITKWEQYQYASDGDPTNSARQKRYYDRHKSEAGAKTKRKTNGSQRYPNALAKRPDTDTDTDTDTEREIPKGISCDEDFEHWYSAYPSHVGKGQARKAYRTARKKVAADILLAGAVSAKQRYADSEPRFTPHPATWLNGERWLDVDAGRGESDPYRGAI